MHDKSRKKSSSLEDGTSYDEENEESMDPIQNRISEDSAEDLGSPMARNKTGMDRNAMAVSKNFVYKLVDI
jgi:hypothetical protein